MKRTLLALVIFALLNFAYSFWPRSPGGAEATSTTTTANQPATHVRSAAATSPATTQAPVKAEPSKGTQSAATPRPRPHFFEKSDRSLPAQRDPSTVQSEKDQFVKTYRSGVQADLNGMSYDVLNLRAIPKNEYVPEMGNIVSERLNYILVDGKQGLVADTTFPVVARTSNGMIGIVTGTFIAKVKKLADVSTVAQAHGLNVKFVDEDTTTAYFSAAPASALGDLLAALRSDPSVERASLEVILSYKRF